jgi:hypothetical protein
MSALPSPLTSPNGTSVTEEAQPEAGMPLPKAPGAGRTRAPPHHDPTVSRPFFVTRPAPSLRRETMPRTV